MPKQRNHPHHHSRADRARRRGSLRLPELRWFVNGPYYVFPPGWLSRTYRTPWGRPLGFGTLVAFAWLMMIFACYGGLALLQALLGAR